MATIIVCEGCKETFLDYSEYKDHKQICYGNHLNNNNYDSPDEDDPGFKS